MLAFIIADSAAESGVLHMPIGWLIAIGTGLVGALTFIYHQQTASQEKLFMLAQAQNAATMEHHNDFVKKSDAERAKADEDRAGYIKRLETITQGIAQERMLLGEQIVKSQSANTEALTMNTRAREAATIETKELMREVVGAVIMKLSELGYLHTPSKKPPAKRHALSKPVAGKSAAKATR